MTGRVLVLMPTYNERDSLPVTLTGLLAHNPTVTVLVIDDNSPDGTGQIAAQIAAGDQRVNVLHRQQKEGLGKAYLAGFEWGFANGFDWLVEMDADGSHRPQDLPTLLAATTKADLVIGSRWTKGGRVENWPRYRELISRTGNLYARTVLRSEVRDLTAGFRVYNSQLLAKLPLASVNAQGYGFQVEMAWQAIRAGANVVEVPIVFVERTLGESKMSLRIVIEALLLTTLWGLKSLFEGPAKSRHRQHADESE